MSINEYKDKLDKKNEQMLKLVFENLELASENISLFYENENLKKKIKVLEGEVINNSARRAALKDKDQVFIIIGKKGYGFKN